MIMAGAVLPVQRDYESWGRYPAARPVGVVPVSWSGEPPRLPEGPPLLAYGLGRSYGDACLNDGGILLETRPMSRFISFDRDSGALSCDAGVSLEEILALAIPAGWFLPVTPGTKYVTVGGAIANDVHGKNHHRAGNFGHHVRRLELLRSSGDRVACSPEQNGELFAATIGGLGLTGLILTADIQLKRVGNPHIAMERIRYGRLEEFFPLSRESDEAFEYTVAWIDCLATGRGLGRGLFMRGNHAAPQPFRRRRERHQLLRVPFQAPSFVLHPLAMRAFNTLYYRQQLRGRISATVHYDPFFYPLDIIDRWNLLYGKRGFVQYQCVLPPAVAVDALRELLGRITASHAGSFLAILKTFGDMPSRGLMSFPRPGATLALDFAFHGQRTLALLSRLDEVVAQAGGAIYPAKDARMSPAHFRQFFPRMEAFRRFMDPRFSSSLWRRVTAA